MLHTVKHTQLEVIDEVRFLLAEVYINIFEKFFYCAKKENYELASLIFFINVKYSFVKVFILKIHFFSLYLI